MDRISKVSYFPGCSLKSSGADSNYALLSFLEKSGIEAKELKDWNCCGSSSVKGIDPELSDKLLGRNLSLAPEKMPMLSPCPGCHMKLRCKQKEYAQSPVKQKKFEKDQGKKFNPDLDVINFFDLVPQLEKEGAFKSQQKSLKGLKVAVYYGCMLSRPPILKNDSNYYGVMERIVKSLGGEPVPWSHSSRCCGTYLSAAKPEIVKRSVETIMSGALKGKADCIVTACSMCQLNLEMRAEKSKVPVLFFSDLISMAMGTSQRKNWLKRHLIDPSPGLIKKGIICKKAS
jgi:heterodisulfide reductase subunit B